MTTYFALHTRFTAQPGRAGALAEILLAAAGGLRANDDCLFYLVSRSPDDPDTIWVTEAWTGRAAHDASLQDGAVRDAIGRARPMIVSISPAELQLVGGKGI